jgi:hypothetical protein
MAEARKASLDPKLLLGTTGDFPPGISILIPLSSLLFLSTVLAGMVGVIYFLVLPEVKDYYAS